MTQVIGAIAKVVEHLLVVAAEAGAINVLIAHRMPDPIDPGAKRGVFTTKMANRRGNPLGFVARGQDEACSPIAPVELLIQHRPRVVTESVEALDCGEHAVEISCLE
ncbi:MAG TPA: hypothetical protein PKM12_02905 [Marmoricola sp.]|nr:hypothetical protein [Marmoricola sp.]